MAASPAAQLPEYNPFLLHVAVHGLQSQGQSSFPPILLNHGRDIPHYESLLVVEEPETSDAVFMIHNIIRGAHSFWP